MSNVPVATRKDIDDVLQVLDTMRARIDSRFTKVERDIADTQKKIQNILNHLDSIEKRLEISDDESLKTSHFNLPLS